MNKTLGEVKFYTGEVEDILYYSLLPFHNEVLIVTKKNKYIISMDSFHNYNLLKLDKRLDNKDFYYSNNFCYVLKEDGWYCDGNIESISIWSCASLE